MSRLRRRFVIPRPAAAAAAFSPSDISGLLIWTKSDTGVTQVANAVSAWADQSGNGNNLNQSTAASKPTYSASDSAFNNKPSISFDGVNDVLTTAANVTFDVFTIFMVTTSTAPTAGVFYSSMSSGDDYGLTELYGTTVTTTYVERLGLSARELTANWGNFTTTPKTVTHSCNGTRATDSIWLNGTSQSLTNAAGTSDPGALSTSKKFNLGARIDLVFPNTMKIAEVILYNTALSAGNRTSVESYLQTRYAHY